MPRALRGATFLAMTNLSCIVFVHFDEEIQLHWTGRGFKGDHFLGYRFSPRLVTAVPKEFQSKVFTFFSNCCVLGNN